MKRGPYSQNDWAALRGPISIALQTKDLYAVAEDFGIKYNTLKHFVYTNKIKVHVAKERRRPTPKSPHLPTESAMVTAQTITTTEFRREIGKHLETVFEDGALLVTNERRGTFVVLTVDEYNYLKRGQSSMQRISDNSDPKT